MICDALNEHVNAQYIGGKQREWDDSCTRVSAWESNRYLVAD